MNRHLSSFCSWLLTSTGLLAQVPIGAELQVNTTTLFAQYNPDIAMAADGSFIVVWHTTTEVFGQLIDSTGAPIGGEFQVNSHTTGTQKRPSVTMAADGNFIVTWAGEGVSDPDYFQIQIREFEADGTPVGDDFQVNTFDGYRYPQIDRSADGEFVVTWIGGYGPPYSSGVQSQILDSYGSLVGDQIWVNPNTEFASWPRLAKPDAGNFMVVWSGGGPADPVQGAVGQLLDGDGTLVGDEFQINSHTAGIQQRPDVAPLANSEFAVAHQDRDRDALVVQRFDNAGSPLGAEQLIVDQSSLAHPAITVGSAGEFIVVWNSRYSAGSDNSGWSIQGQVLGPQLDPVGSQFQINTYEFNDQRNPRVAASADGKFVLTWQSRGSSGTDTSDWSVQAQRFASIFIFTDGFESGDTSAWSSTQ